MTSGRGAGKGAAEPGTKMSAHGLSQELAERRAKTERQLFKGRASCKPRGPASRERGDKTGALGVVSFSSAGWDTVERVCGPWHTWATLRAGP